MQLMHDAKASITRYHSASSEDSDLCLHLNVNQTNSRMGADVSTLPIL